MVDENSQISYSYSPGFSGQGTSRSSLIISRRLDSSYIEFKMDRFF
jgi:hypothetical protein